MVVAVELRNKNESIATSVTDFSPFLQQISTLERIGQFPSNVTFEKFSDYYSRLHYPTDLIIKGFLHLKNEQFRDTQGNPVNYFTTVAETMLRTMHQRQLHLNTEQFVQSEGFVEAINNLVSMVAEHPLADVTKRETRVETWVFGKKGLRLRGQFGYLDEILEEALVSSQTLPFEKPRFHANLENYHKLVAGRKRGDDRVFVEFSPSPTITPLAQNRGYLGNSCIFFFNHDPSTHTETVEQRWIKTDWLTFARIVGELGLHVPQNYTDVDLMKMSGFLNSDKANQLHELIDLTNGKFVAHQDELNGYVWGELREFIAGDLSELLIRGSWKLIHGQGIEEESKELMDALRFAQFTLRHKIQEITGISAVAISVTAQELKRLTVDWVFRVQFVEKNDLPLSGCGFGSSSLLDEVGSSVGAAVFGRDKHGHREFHCEKCNTSSIRQVNTLFTNCPNCGEKIPC